VQNGNETGMLYFTFRLSHVKKKIAFHVSFERNVTKYFIFMKITLERKKFRLRFMFLCSNVTKNRCVSRFVRAKRDVETLTPLCVGVDVLCRAVRSNLTDAFDYFILCQRIAAAHFLFTLWNNITVPNHLSPKIIPKTQFSSGHYFFGQCY
jgi:hypothetical protein